MSAAPPAEPWPVFSLTAGAHVLRSVLKVLEPFGGGMHRSRPSSPELRLAVDSDGLHVRMVDPSHVAMVVLDVARSALGEFTVDTPGIVGVDAGKIAEFLKVPTGTHDPVRIWTEPAPEPSGRKIRMGAGHVVRTSSTIDPSGLTEPKIPALEPTVRAAGVDSGEFARAVK